LPLVAMVACALGAELAVAQSPVVSEFAAANTAGLRDEDGDFSDWIEIYNPAQVAVSLAGWYLTDTELDPARWRFPAVTVPAQGYLVVFASGKDRVNPSGRLHTSFRLDRGGGYLALVQPDGATIASDFGIAYPGQVGDVSYGRRMVVESELLIPAEARAYLMVPENDTLGLAWTQTGFDHSGWTPVTTGVGYYRPQDVENPPEPGTPLEDVTQPGDPLVATSSNSPGSEDVTKAIDNNPQTKYLNFDKLNAGFTVTPAAGKTLITGLRFTSANDAPDRDPTSYILSGSNDGKSFTEIARGPIPAFPTRFHTLDVLFTNRVSYSIYRLLFPTVQNATVAVAMQIAEVQFLGFAGSAPAALAELIRTSVEAEMFGRSSAACLRFPFVLSDLHPPEHLALRMRYDDGFAAFLNGIEVARANVPASPGAGSVAVTNRNRFQAAQEQLFDLTSFAPALRVGTNVLAILALNDRANSPDFLLQARLERSWVTLGAESYFDLPTPGAPNGAGISGLVTEVDFSPKRGFYETPFDLALSTDTPGATIRYTTDGSPPTPAHGIPYAGPIHIDRTTILRAAAFLDGWRASRVKTHTYVLLGEVIHQRRESALAAGFPTNWNSQLADYGLDPRIIGPAGQDAFGGKYAATLEEDLRSLPSMSVVMDRDDMFGAQGIYSNPEMRGDAWERPASIELMYPDQRDGFQEDAGILVQGGAFRRFDLTLKKSFRIVFREKYGRGTLHYPLFGPDATDRLDSFILRANSNDAWPWGGSGALYVRDAFAMESARAMGMVASHTTFVHLYINGLYWGLYNPVERPDAAFSAAYRGGDKETWDAINQDSVPDGNYDAWNRLLALLNQGMQKNEVYQRVQGNNPDGTRNPAYEDLLDMRSLADYIILNCYAGNTDWPGRNWWVGRDRNNGDGFHFYPWDTETALGMTGLDADRTAVSDAVARPYAAARTNADFRMLFADRVYRHFFHGGAFYVNPAKPAWDPLHPENNVPAARFAALAETVRRAMVGESARWGDQLVGVPFARDEHWQRARDSLLGAFFPQRSAIVLNQFRRAGLYPRTEAPVMSRRGGAVEPGFALVLSAAQGNIYYTTNGADPRAPVTGQPAAAALPYADPIVLRDLVTIRARTLNGQEWSALNEATFVVGTPKLVISEVHYHPADPDEGEIAAGFVNSDDFEFIELANRGVGTYDLRGVRFVSGVDFIFSGSAITNLAAGECALAVRNRAAFEKRYGAGLPIAGEYSGRLDNAGERVRLLDGEGGVILDFTYKTFSPWPESADGTGPSLEVIDPETYLSSPFNWRASLASGGTPGKPGPAPVPSLEVIGGNGLRARFAFQGKAGGSYTVHVCDAVLSDAWRVHQSIPALARDQVVEIVVDIDSGGTARFFRLTSP
jgi:hypothetical protein